MSITDPNFKLTAREHKGKVARTHKDNTTDCRLTRTQYENLPNHEKVAQYFATQISAKAQADFYNNARAALESFANSLPLR